MFCDVMGVMVEGGRAFYLFFLIIAALSCDAGIELGGFSDNMTVLSQSAVGPPPVVIGIYGLCQQDDNCDVYYSARLIKELGFDAVVVTVVGNGFDDRISRAFYPSKYLPQFDPGNGDFLYDAVNAAHKNGLFFCASVDMPHGDWLYQKGHGDWIAVLSDGRHLDMAGDSPDYCVITPARVIRSPEYLAMMKGIFDELAARGVDSIDLNDNFQYPALFYGDNQTLFLSSYDDFSIAQFSNDTGIKVQSSDARASAIMIENDAVLRNEWNRWRANQTKRLLAILQGYVDEINIRRGTSIVFRPHLLADPEIAYENYGTDNALIAGLVDVVYLMMDANIPESQYGAIVEKMRQAGAKKIVASTYLIDVEKGDYEKLERRMASLKEQGVAGISIYNLEMANERHLIGRLPQLTALVKAKPAEVY